MPSGPPQENCLGRNFRSTVGPAPGKPVERQMTTISCLSLPPLWTSPTTEPLFPKGTGNFSHKGNLPPTATRHATNWAPGGTTATNWAGAILPFVVYSNHKAAATHNHPKANDDSTLSSHCPHEGGGPGRCATPATMDKSFLATNEMSPFSERTERRAFF